MRVVLSARSRNCPVCTNHQPSSWISVALAMPFKCSEPALISWKNSLGLRCQTLRACGERTNKYKPVQFLPQFERELVAHHAGVFARGADRLDDGIRILGLEHEKFRDGLAGRARVQFEKRLFVAGGLHDGQPVARRGVFRRGCAGRAGVAGSRPRCARCFRRARCNGPSSKANGRRGITF